MKINFKEIHIGALIQMEVEHRKIDIKHICNFMELSETEIIQMYNEKYLSTDLLLMWSKFLGYDLFRIYSQHLILYAPASVNNKPVLLSKFTKNMYTKEIIDFILDLINRGEKTRLQVMVDYNIPSSTLSKWITKYEVERR